MGRRRVERRRRRPAPPDARRARSAPPARPARAAKGSVPTFPSSWRDRGAGQGVGERITPLGDWPCGGRSWRARGRRADRRSLPPARRRTKRRPSGPRATSASLAAVDALQRADLGALQAALVNHFHDVPGGVSGTRRADLHAQRNLDEVVEKNHTLRVMNDEFIRILGNRMNRIEKNLEEIVKGDHTSTVEETEST